MLIGDLMSIYYCKGLFLQDMEFYQFYFIGLVKLGILVMEGICGEGGILCNFNGECFMECYVLIIKDFVLCDIVVCFMIIEICEGCGVGKDKDVIYIDLIYLLCEVIEGKFVEIIDFVCIYLGQDLVKDFVMVQLIVYYVMGGIFIDFNGLCFSDGNGGFIEGLYVVGEQVCVLLYGVNCLGINSLGDFVVFGCCVGCYVVEYVKQVEYVEMFENVEVESWCVFDDLCVVSGKDNVVVICKELQEMMMCNVGIFCNGFDMVKQVEIIKEFKICYKNVGVLDINVCYNFELVEVFEFGFMFDCVEVMVSSVVNCIELCGVYDCEDFYQCDDVNWFKYIMVYWDMNNFGNVLIGYKDVVFKGFMCFFEFKFCVY